jgi:hypothetical protein
VNKTLPDKHDIFILAENLRQELNGKVSILGAYAAGQILIGDSEKLPATIPLAMYILFKTGEGTFNPKVSITFPSGQRIGPFQTPQIMKAASQPMSLLLNFFMMRLPEIGIYKIEIDLDDRVYADHFSLQRLPKIS